LSRSHSAAGLTKLSPVDVLGHREVGLPQDAGVVVEAREGVARVSARRGIDGEAGGQRLRPLLEPLDAQELVAEGLLVRAARRRRSRRSTASRLTRRASTRAGREEAADAGSAVECFGHEQRQMGHGSAHGGLDSPVGWLRHGARAPTAGEPGRGSSDRRRPRVLRLGEARADDVNLPPNRSW